MHRVWSLCPLYFVRLYNVVRDRDKSQGVVADTYISLIVDSVRSRADTMKRIERQEWQPPTVVTAVEWICDKKVGEYRRYRRWKSPSRFLGLISDMGMKFLGRAEIMQYLWGA